MVRYFLYISKKIVMKVKVELEFPINSSPQLLYQYISSPSGLSEWFADNVNSRGEFYDFQWDQSIEKAKLTSKKTDEKIKFRWLDDDGVDTDYYFEFKIVKDELTKGVTLVITDFADEDEVDDHSLLWEKQITDLKKVLGSA